MRVLLLHTYDPDFLRSLDLHDSKLGDLDFEEQRSRLLSTKCCLADAYSAALQNMGCEAHDLIVNADVMQARWAYEHGVRLHGNVHDRRRQIVAAQVEHFRPDVLYVFEWCPLGDAFLAELKRRVPLVVAQIGSPVRSNRTYRAYDLVISSIPPLVAFFRREGFAAEHLKLAFDARVLEQLAHGRLTPSAGADSPSAHNLSRGLQPARSFGPTGAIERGESAQAGACGSRGVGAAAQFLYDVTFVGGFAPSHPDRVRWLERLLEQIDVAVYGYGVENVPPESPVRAHHHGPAWGWHMYDVFQRSRITLNRHACIDVRGQSVSGFANNMRLYEATGVGTCLLTEMKENLAESFKPDMEVVTYTNDEECIEKVCYYLEHDDERTAVARRGQQRTLRDHTYAVRMAELYAILGDYLSGSAARRVTGVTARRAPVVAVGLAETGEGGREESS